MVKPLAQINRNLYIDESKYLNDLFDAVFTFTKSMLFFLFAVHLDMRSCFILFECVPPNIADLRQRLSKETDPDVRNTLESQYSDAMSTYRENVNVKNNSYSRRQIELSINSKAMEDPALFKTVAEDFIKNKDRKNHIKIHLQITNVWSFIELMNKVLQFDKRMGSLIFGFKVRCSEVPEKAVPYVVIYPNRGCAEELLRKCVIYFGHIPPIEGSPRYNKHVYGPVYYAYGDGDTKRQLEQARDTSPQINEFLTTVFTEDLSLYQDYRDISPDIGLLKLQSYSPI